MAAEPPKLQDASTPSDCQCEPWDEKSQRLIVCIDGTSNQFGKNNTNVVELHSRLRKGQGEKQATYYSSGIGTYARPSYFSLSALKQRIGNGIDLAIALNFARIVKNAYRWLVDHYQHGDRIFLFGFSRGAYQVRTLAAMIKTVGLLYSGNTELIPFAYELYINSMKDAEDLCTPFKQTFSRDVSVHFVGVWDTVSSVGLVRGKPYPLTDSCEHICIFRHALALDERRVKFLPEYAYGRYSQAKVGLKEARTKNTMARNKPVDILSDIKDDDESSQAGPSTTRATQDRSARSSNTSPDDKSARTTEHVKEVWFAGSHSDIGGGNRQNIALDLSGVPLLWMENEATLAGLQFQPRGASGTEWKWDDLRNDKPNNSLTLGWLPLEFLPIKRLSYVEGRKHTRSLHRGQGRTIVEGQRIHVSLAFKASELYRPLASFAGKGIDWDGLIGSGSIEHASWAEDIKDRLEMDLFDPSIVDHIVGQIRRPPSTDSLVSALKRLFFIALSDEGTAAIIRKEGAIADIVGYLEHKDSSVRSNSANCLSELARHGHSRSIQNVDMRGIFSEENRRLFTDQAIPHLRGMLSDEDWAVRLSSIHCLLHLSNFGISIWSLNEPVRQFFLAEGAPLFSHMLQQCAKQVTNVDHDVQNEKQVSTGTAATIDSKQTSESLNLFFLPCSVSNLARNEQLRKKVITIDVINDLVQMVTMDSPAQIYIARCIAALAQLEHLRALMSTTDVVDKIAANLRTRTSADELRHNSRCLLNLAKHDKLRRQILDKGLISLLASMMKMKDTRTRKNTMDLLPQFVKFSDFRVEIAKTDIMQSLLRSLKTDNYSLQETSAWCLSQLAEFDFIRRLMHESGIVSQMTSLLKNRNTEVRKAGMEYLQPMAAHADLQSDIMDSELVKKLTKILKTASPDLQEYSAWCLSQLAKHEVLQPQIIKNNVMLQLAKMLKSDDADVCKAGLENIPAFARYDYIRAELNATDIGTSLSNLLKSKNVELQDSSAWCLSELARYDFMRERLLDNGVIARLAQMLSDDDLEVQKAAMEYLPVFAKIDGLVDELTKSDIVQSLLTIYRNGNAQYQYYSLWGLTGLATRETLGAQMKDKGLMLDLASTLASGDLRQFQDAVDALPIFAKHVGLRTEIAKSNIIETLVSMLDTREYDYQEYSAWVFAELSEYDVIRPLMIEHGTFSKLSKMLISSDSKIRGIVIEYLPDFAKHEDLLTAIVANKDIVHQLAKILESEDSVQINNSAHCIAKLIEEEPIRPQILENGIVPQIVRMIESDNPSVRYTGMYYCPKFAQYEIFRAEFLSTDAIRKYSGILKGDNSEQQRWSVDRLSLLAEHQFTAPSILDNGVIPQLAKMLGHDDMRVRNAVMNYIPRFATIKDVQDELMRSEVIPTMLRILETGEEVLRERSAWGLVEMAEQVHARRHILALGLLDRLAELLESNNDQIEEIGRKYLPRIARFPESREIIATTTIPSLATLLRGEKPSARYEAVTIIYQFAKYDDCHGAILAHRIIPELLHIMQDDPYVAIRATAAIKLLNCARHDVLRKEMVKCDAIDQIHKAIRSTAPPVLITDAFLKLGKQVPKGSRTLSGYTSAVADAILVMRELCKHEDSVTAICNTQGLIDAFTSCVLRSRDSEVQLDGSMSVLHISAFEQGRAALLKTNALKALEDLRKSIHRNVQLYAEDAIHRLTMSDADRQKEDAEEKQRKEESQGDTSPD